VVVEDFNTPLSSIHSSSKQRINKEILDLKYTIEQMDLLITGTIHQEDITIVNTGAPNVCAPNFIKHG
jgi:hypothetical protein